MLEQSSPYPTQGTTIPLTLTGPGVFVPQKRDVNEGEKMRETNERQGKNMFKPPQVLSRLIFMVLCLNSPLYVKISKG